MGILLGIRKKNRKYIFLERTKIIAQGHFHTVDSIADIERLVIQIGEVDGGTSDRCTRTNRAGT